MSSKKEFLSKEIECPKCFVPARREDFEILGPNIQIDICPKCDGVWLDGGELNKILKDKKMSDYLTKDIGTQSKSKLVCPRCGGLMDLEYADDLAVDVCLICKGVWLDAGELEDLKAKSHAGFEGDDSKKTEERYEEMVKNRRRSFLGRFLGRFG